MGSPRTLSTITTARAGAEITADSLLLLPVGAVEQHGPHLPLGTDTILVDAVCRAVVDGAADAWLLPTQAVGRSTEHVGSPGTLSLQTSTLLAVLDDLAASISRWPARKLVLVNGHGGNTAVLQAALRDLRARHGLETFLVRPFADLRDPEGPRSAIPEVHGGYVETSLMLHVAPDLVDLDAAAPAAAALPDDLDAVRLGGSVAFGWLMEDLNPTGVVGDPTRSDADLGAALFDQLRSRVGDQLAEVGRFRFGGSA